MNLIDDVHFVSTPDDMHAAQLKVVHSSMGSSCKVAHSGDEELEDVDLALFFRRFPAVNDLTLCQASQLTSEAYKALAEVCMWSRSWCMGIYADTCCPG